jgi:hypothetical protein
MKKLLGVERNNGRVERTWSHYDADGKASITVETVQDVAPILDANKRQYNDAPSKWGDFAKVASIPTVVIENTAKGCAALWGISVREAYSEIVASKTDRARQVWRELLNSREFRYFRTRPGYVPVKAQK